MAHWKYNIDLKGIWNDDTLSSLTRRTRIVKALRDTLWYGDHKADLEPLLDCLAKTRTQNGFNKVWDAVYDYADATRCWISTLV